MTALEQIKTAVSNGLRRPAIEALLGRTLKKSEVTEYQRARAVFDLQLRKRR